MSSLKLQDKIKEIHCLLDEINEINNDSCVLQDYGPVTINQIRELLAHPRCLTVDIKELYLHVRELYLNSVS